MREAVRNFVESSRFEWTITSVIILNAAVLGLETVPAAARAYGGVLGFLDTAAISIFVVEIALKLYAYGWRFFKSGWNIFDLLIVGVALVPASQQYSVLRALRILRVLRIISVVPSMRQVVQGLLGAIPSMGSVIALLLLLFYISAVMATKLFGGEFPQWFGTIGESFYSLFQIMTLESWSMGIVRPVMAEFPYAWAFFVPFILITSFIVLNLFIAIIVTAMEKESAQESSDEREEILSEIRAMRREIAALKQ